MTIKSIWKIISKFLITALTLTIIISIVTIFNKKELFNNKLLHRTKSEVKSPITYSLVDNTNEYLKTILRIEKDNNIESIQYMDIDNKPVILRPVNKNIVAIDLKVKVAQDMVFKIISNGIEETQVLNIPTDYINNYITLDKDDSNSTEKQYRLIANYTTDLQNEPITNYYKVGNRVNYSKYTRTF